MGIVALGAVEKIIGEVAATEIMPFFGKLRSCDIEMKGPGDPVSAPDKACEIELSRRLKELLPGSVVVGEEGCAKDSEIVNLFESDGSVWVIDPIDGTNNFINGRMEFGVMVALVHNKETVAAWIHDPNTGHTLMAEKGGGVWLQGGKMRLAGQDNAASRLVIVGSRMVKALSKFADLIAALPALEIGSSSAFDYGRLFTGDDGSCFANSSKPRSSFLLFGLSKPWDHLPGLFLVAEAGGYSCDFRGRPYDPQRPENGIFVAPSEGAGMALFETIKRVIGDNFSFKNAEVRIGSVKGSNLQTKGL
ncbi:MAG: inositol monophosphatase [Bdellovibrionales bacterium]